MRTLILNSSQTKYPRGCHSWVQATFRAVEQCVSTDTEFLTSSSPFPWDLAAYLLGRTGARLMMAIPCMDTEEGRRRFTSAVRDLELDASNVSPLYITAGEPLPEKEGWRLRDRRIIRTADRIVPVSVNPKGRLAGLLATCAERKIVDNAFRTPWKRENRLPFAPVDNRMVNPEPPGEWCAHWTRSSQGPWPDETTASFIRDMLARPECYVRSAHDTLVRILREKRIRGTGRHMPDGRKAVGFTSRTLRESVGMMRWRKRYVRMEYEPWGIAVRRSSLRELGGRPVEYTDESAHRRNDPFLQGQGPDGVWRDEREWRLYGDLDLGRMDTDDYFVIVPDTTALGKIGQTEICRAGIHALFR